MLPKLEFSAVTQTQSVQHTLGVLHITFVGLGEQEALIQPWNCWACCAVNNKPFVSDLGITWFLPRGMEQWQAHLLAFEWDEISDAPQFCTGLVSNVSNYLPSRATDILDMPRYYPNSFNFMETQRGEMIFPRLHSLLTVRRELNSVLQRRWTLGSFQISVMSLISFRYLWKWLTSK